jgi:dienelactone hydrolase
MNVRPLVAMLAVAMMTLATDAAHAEMAIVRSTVVLSTRRGPIKAELFEPRGGASSAVVVLHGAGGLLLDGPEMRRVARHLAAAGHAAYVVHYFESTGTLFALDAAMQRHFATWLQTVREAIPAVQAARGNSAAVGIYGYSLGAFLALQAASDNPSVSAVVEHAGGVWNRRYENLGRLPPVLMIHGERDARVPFAKYAEPLVPVLRRRAAALQTRFFPDEGHGFTPTAMVQVREEAAHFFRQHLRR